MLKTLLSASLHRVRVTETDLDNLTPGERFSTCAIGAPRESGTISLSGAAARKAMRGALRGICADSPYAPAEFADHRAVVVRVSNATGCLLFLPGLLAYHGFANHMFAVM